MQNLSAPILPVQPAASATTASAASNKNNTESDGESFNTILAKEQAGKAPQADTADKGDKSATTTDSAKPNEETAATSENPAAITQPGDAMTSLLMTMNPLAGNPDLPSTTGGKILPGNPSASDKTTPDNLPAFRMAATDSTLQTGVSGKTVAGANNKSPANPAAPGNFMPGFSDIAGKMQAAVAGEKNLLAPADNTLSSGLFSSPENGSVVAAPVIQTGSLTPATHAVRLETPVSSPAWGDDLSQKVTWLATQKNQVAELHLNPAHLGPIEITLTINNDDRQATAQFVSNHLAVREAIESALPKLREMMAENGISLNNVNVSADSPRQQAEQSPRQSAQHHFSGNTSQQPADHPGHHGVMHLTTHGRHEGMVDIFA